MLSDAFIKMPSSVHSLSKIALSQSHSLSPLCGTRTSTLDTRPALALALASRTCHRRTCSPWLGVIACLGRISRLEPRYPTVHPQMVQRPFERSQEFLDQSLSSWQDIEGGETG